MPIIFNRYEGILLLDNSIDEIVKRYADIVKKNIDVKMVLLYGSHARGDQREYSDIDVAVIVDDIGEDYLEKSAKLASLVWDIDTRIEPNLLCAKYDRSGFLESIMKYGKIIYSSI